MKTRRSSQEVEDKAMEDVERMVLKLLNTNCPSSSSSVSRAIELYRSVQCVHHTSMLLLPGGVGVVDGSPLLDPEAFKLRMLVHNWTLPSIGDS
jgi:hypothetical protein